MDRLKIRDLTTCQFLFQDFFLVLFYTYASLFIHRLLSILVKDISYDRLKTKLQYSEIV